MNVDLDLDKFPYFPTLTLFFVVVFFALSDESQTRLLAKRKVREISKFKPVLFSKFSCTKRHN